MFNGFANFYRRFIQAFSRIATSLTSMLRTTSSTSLPASVRAPIVVDDEIGIGGGGEIGKTIKSNESKNTEENTAGHSLLSSDARLAFTEAPIFCYLIAYLFSRYETHIVKAFKSWRDCLEGCKHKALVLTDHNKLRQFMDTKNLRSRSVCWAQELF